LRERLEIPQKSPEILKDTWRSPGTKIPEHPQRFPEIRFPGIPRIPEIRSLQIPDLE